jgi:hypothetical protein
MQYLDLTLLQQSSLVQRLGEGKLRIVRQVQRAAMRIRCGTAMQDSQTNTDRKAQGSIQPHLVDAFSCLFPTAVLVVNPLTASKHHQHAPPF